jgi:hypothetical protein
MRALITKVGRLNPAWILAVALLALPDCGFQASPGFSPNFFQGEPPLNTLVTCEIETPVAPPVVARHCANAEELQMGIRLASAAVALNTGAKSAIGLDESPTAHAHCGGGPEAVIFAAAFPDGLAACLNGDLMQSGPQQRYNNPNDVCVARCKDFVGTTDDKGTFTPTVPSDPDTTAWCEAHARASTNLPISPNAGILGGCTEAGQQIDNPFDPRFHHEAVLWQDQIGTNATLTQDPFSPPVSTLTRTAATTGNLDAGAASTQQITRGDAYVEFSAPVTTTFTAVAGFSMATTGPDTDPSLNDINFGISLNRDGRFYVIENGVIIPGGDVNNSFGTFSAGERFRVSLVDNSDHTASVNYSRIVGACVPRQPCTETVFFTRPGNAAQYPLRVDASFREQGSILSDVRLVRIQ